MRSMDRKKRMIVIVRGFSIIEDYFKNKYKKNPITLRIESGTTIEELIKILDIPRNEAGIVIVNGSVVHKEHVLNQRDDVKLFAPLGGG